MFKSCLRSSLALDYVPIVDLQLVGPFLSLEFSVSVKSLLKTVDLPLFSYYITIIIHKNGLMNAKNVHIN
jgi:hypothetical protein